MSPRLLAITDRRVMGLDDVSRLAGKHGSDVAFVVREKDLSARELLVYARAVIDRAGACTVLVTDRLDVARVLGSGAQLPENGVDVAAARQWLGARAIVSASRHSVEGALRAAEAGADWITVAPVFAKPGAVPLGVEGLSRAVSAVAGRALIFALGGVDARTAPLARAAGADGVAAIRAAWAGEL